MQLDFTALHEDAALARAQLWNAHCKNADNPNAAAMALYAVLFVQARAVLEAAYGGDKRRAREHEVQMLAS